jgi:hypothetical protein
MCARAAASRARREREHEPELAGAGTVITGKHEQHQPDRAEDEPEGHEEQQRRAQEHVTQEPAKSLEYIGDRTARLSVLGTKLRADGEDAQERRGVADRVCDERERATGAEQHAAQGRSEHAGQCAATRVRRYRLAHALRADHAPHSCRFGGAEQHPERRLEERDEQDVRVPEVTKGEREREQARVDDAPEVAGHEDRAAAQPVDERPRRQAQDERGRGKHGADRAGFDRRAGDRQHDDRVRERRHADAEVRDRLPEPERSELAVVSERSVHADTVEIVGGQRPREERLAQGWIASPDGEG